MKGLFLFLLLSTSAFSNTDDHATSDDDIVGKRFTTVRVIRKGFAWSAAKKRYFCTFSARGFTLTGNIESGEVFEVISTTKKSCRDCYNQMDPILRNLSAFASVPSTTVTLRNVNSDVSANVRCVGQKEYLKTSDALKNTLSPIETMEVFSDLLSQTEL